MHRIRFTFLPSQDILILKKYRKLLLNSTFSVSQYDHRDDKPETWTKVDVDYGSKSTPRLATC